MTVEYLQCVDFSGEPIYADNTGNGTEQKSIYCIDCERNISKFLKDNKG